VKVQIHMLIILEKFLFINWLRLLSLSLAVFRIQLHTCVSGLCHSHTHNLHLFSSRKFFKYHGIIFLKHLLLDKQLGRSLFGSHSWQLLLQSSWWWTSLNAFCILWDSTGSNSKTSSSKVQAIFTFHSHLIKYLRRRTEEHD